ncbi:MAG TPA: efflux RND transporter periplasmic adaptor subunit [Vicinamibacterales bacterium]|jgi:cobalt-zinc-cadmium efflux system membrane fusion protein|nr:efflux RND transporter periplasmic adaptor subunit [Vicinamibacterales bacterium]
MKHVAIVHRGLVCAALAAGLAAAGCTAQGQTSSTDGAPPPAQVVQESDGSVVSVQRPDQFPLATATTHRAPLELTVTGSVNPDIARAVPAISLASGRVVEIHARLGDQVEKGQLLLRVQSSDVASAWSDYQHALADEVLARAQFERAKDLFGIGAIAKKDLEVAQDTEDKAVVDVRTTRERLRVMGVDSDKPPNSIVDIIAPVSGVITDQQVTNAAGVQSLGTNPFTISDLSWVWVVCDVYENDLANLHIGDSAEIHLAAYPDRTLTGRISNILPTLDPNIRTAKVRIEVRNPGLLRLGMFVTATFRGQQMQDRAAVPATAIVHLHDRDFVYVPVGPQTTTAQGAPPAVPAATPAVAQTDARTTPPSAAQFRRVEVVAGNMLPSNLQEILSGLQPGARVVTDGLAFANTVGQ